jgi:nucleotide-binding universal stress UspA family protein
MSESTRAPRIVVGVDGSPASLAALRWAWDEARFRGIGVEIAACWHYPAMPFVLSQPPISAEQFEQGAREVAADAIATVIDTQAAADIEVTVLEGAPSLALLELAHTAEMVVVGSRGRGGFAGLLLGSVSQHLAEHAPCPVVIVHAEE